MGRPAYGVRGMDLDKKDYIVGMAITPKDEPKANGGNGKKKNGEAEEEVVAEAKNARLILSVTEMDTASARTLTSTACNRAAAKASST